MKKTKKKKRIIIIVILLALAVLAFLGYRILFDNIDPDEKAAIEGEMEQITQDILDSIKEEGDQITESEGGTESNQPSEKSDDNRDKILAIYNKGFSKLEEQGNGIVDRLVNGIKADYDALTASGAGKSQLAKLATSYTNRAKVLESGMDSSVNAMLSQMSIDLKAAGASEEEIKAYINEYKEAYNRQKESRRNLILKKAKSFL